MEYFRVTEGEAFFLFSGPVEFQAKLQCVIDLWVLSSCNDSNIFSWNALGCAISFPPGSGPYWSDITVICQFPHLNMGIIIIVVALGVVGS